VNATASPSSDPEELFVPAEPTSVEDTGLGLGFLSDLALKMLYFQGYVTGGEIANQMRLPFSGLVDRVLEFLKREMLCEVKGASPSGLGQATYQYTITGKGIGRAREVLDRGQYVGPAPVTLSDYSEGIRRQPMLTASIHEQTMRQALAHLVIPEDMIERLGPAANSGRSIFLYGDPGNGKTVIAESVGRVILGDEMYIPYAVEVNGMVIKVYDVVNHQPAPETEPTSPLNHRAIRPRFDRRWVRIRRPVLVTGGELTLETLDLVWDDLAKFYEAPFQMKANGGMLLIDDFGRQQVRPRDLLNRWVVPLEKRVDFLTLHTGQKIEVPFQVLIVFSTNLEPRDLVDEAFLRRIRHKIDIHDPSFEEYREIFRRECAGHGIPYDEEVLGYLLQEQYIKPGNPMRACHPRDLLDEITDIAHYRGLPAKLTRDLIDRACQAYFVEL
jgi:predicted ATPase with chaperone activity